jgi:hypothetical protein
MGLSPILNTDGRHWEIGVAAGTQRRRVTANNTVHTRGGLPTPHLAETIRHLLDDSRLDRMDRMDRVRVVAWQRIPQIPTTVTGRGVRAETIVP